MNFQNSRFPKRPLELLSVQEMDELSAVGNTDERQEVESDDIIPILDISSSIPNRAKKITAGQLVNKLVDIDPSLFADLTLSNLSDYNAARDNLGIVDPPPAADLTLSNLSDYDAARANLGIEDIVPTAEINILSLGADPTGSSDNTAVFDNAFVTAQAEGKSIRVPPGTYRVDSLITGVGGVKVICDEGAVIDATNITGGSGIVRYQGSTGPEIAIADPVQRRDNVINTVSSHGLSVGDWILLKSQRSCLHSDAGEWRLGEPTAGDWPVYFAEPLQVETVTSSTSIVVRHRVIFPDYLPNDNNETLPNARPSATIQKINFLENAEWHGGKFKGGGSAGFRINWCFRPRIRNVDFDMSDVDGSSIYAQNTLFGDFKASTYRIPGGATSLSANAYRDVGCWWNKWDVSDVNGWQSMDVTFTNEGHPSFWPDIKITSYASQGDGCTFHPGSFGGKLRIISSGARSRGASIRSRFVQVIDPIVTGPVGSVIAGIELGPWAIDSSVHGGFIEGYQAGVRLDNDYLVYQNPARRNQRVQGVTIRRCVRGVDIRPYGEATNEYSGISIVNCDFEDSEEFHIHSNLYNNGVEVRGNRFGRLGASADEAVIFYGNTYGHVFTHNTADNIGSGKHLVSKAAPSNTTIFPTAQFPDSGMINLFGNHVRGDISTTVYDVPDNVPANVLSGRRGQSAYNDTISGIEHLVASNFPAPASGVIGPSGAGSEMFLGDVDVVKRGGLYLAGSGQSMNVRVNGSPKWRYDAASTNIFRPSVTGDGDLGSASFEINDLFIMNNPTVSSDKRLKQDDRDYNDAELRAFRNISSKIYKLKSSVEKKGDEARYHSGVIAQDVQKALEDEGLDPWVYGFLCKDPVLDIEEWTDEEGVLRENTVHRTDENGEPMYTLSIRYSELLIALLSAERARMDSLESRLEALEKDN